ncbi:bacteriocin immunity protein [Lactiplantibacillus plantarum]|jgi:hypothetical protein|uniref:Immunity protein n=2 Tax=Lactiplantibacillus plantarum TaxID=1590 RepID=Q84HV9_LACPN|nr:putative immunity protein [Lactiplantibacillus plantarum subsp. plantarum NC8]ABD15216.1 immunity protein [Lactiplantibacillus plantarum]AFM80197.1 putative putative immunity protein [Lactiplantibacillus plantarum subsp. plantarum]AGE38112.1 Immunity protein Plnc8C [Lactiplantibacillus plantarum ZJ316]AEO52965.1 immunity protein Plnc8C [Lactiplantibacillus plantarum]
MELLGILSWQESTLEFKAPICSILGVFSVINKFFLKDINFWGWLIVFVFSVKAAVNIDMSSLDWIVQTVFTIVSILGICHVLFHKKSFQK